MRAAELPKSRPRRVLPADAAMAAVILLLGLFLADNGGPHCPAVAVLLGTPRVPRVRRPARHRGEHGRTHRDRLVGHVPCHCRRGGAPGTVREGPRRLGCREVRPRFHAPPRPGRRRTPAAHRTARHGIHRCRRRRARRHPPPCRAIRSMDPDGGPGLPGAAPPGDPPAAPPGTSAVAHPQWRPLSPVIEPGPLAGRPLRLQQPAGQGTEVTVRPGDSLWSLSAARLGPFASDVDIALDWPRLYQANRDIIGANPHLLRPGQILRIPPGP